MYDLIGDIHGHADELVELLHLLGYTEQAGVFRHPSRQIVYCGDFIDRGPRIRDVLKIVRCMVEDRAALAVMGNHEYNAIAFHTARPDQSGQYYRRHSDHNIQQHRETLKQLSTEEMQSAVQWFASLPVALDLGALRVVHACWDSECIRCLQQAVTRYGDFTSEFLRRAADPQHSLFEAVERVLKGPELRLPSGFSVKDKEGSSRSRIRIRWFEDPGEHSLASYSLPSAVHPDLHQLPVQGEYRPAPYNSLDPPVFFGHYWMPESDPVPLRNNIACLDYSVAKGGHLCAYRFNGESALKADHFVKVPSRIR